MDLNKEEIFSRSYLKVLNFLSFKKRSLKEISDFVKKTVSKNHLPLREKEGMEDNIVSMLKKDGYIKDFHDSDFAASYVDSLEKSGKTFNKIKIKEFLRRKGIGSEIINDVLESVSDDQIYSSVLKDAEKKLRTLKDDNPNVKRKKLLNYLYRKGYPFEISSAVVDTLTKLK
jgi:regulatory protein